jgi:hypothetical protein
MIPLTIPEIKRLLTALTARPRPGGEPGRGSPAARRAPYRPPCKATGPPETLHESIIPRVS